ncbi:hypothetical protein [Pseudomonas sp. NPDC089569]|uniref:hypothetical protein n=1 Tax=Pseudomonas sp. NPDC089569 TaxID=3390722 RepID=UPI003D07171E
MKHLFKVAICLVTLSAAFSVLADEADKILERESKLETMRFRRDQLKLQSDMAESWKKMSDASVIVDEDGLPLGVKSIQTLAIEVRSKGRTSEANPFEPGSNGPGQPTTAPNGMPFLSDQQGMLPPQAFQGPQPPLGARAPQLQAPVEPEKKAPAEEEKQILQLIKVEASTVTIRTNEGDHIVRIGEKVNDLTLIKFNVDQAFLKGPKGLQTISINWASK